jgi:hypothetical protein
MRTHTKALALALLVAMLFVAGYAVRRPERRGGDMLDAVAAVQRHGHVERNHASTTDDRVFGVFTVCP